MTERITAMVGFTPLSRRQVVAGFLGGRRTSRAAPCCCGKSIAEHRIDRSTLVKLPAVLVEQFLNSFE